MKNPTIKFDKNGKQLNIIQYYSDKAGNWKQRIIETDYAKEKKQKKIKQLDYKQKFNDEFNKEAEKIFTKRLKKIGIPTEQLEFKLNDKRKEINLETEIINLNKLRRKESNKRRKNHEQKH